ncbi:MAG: hypothetical protein BGO31_12960 [Bacteroidetes bacterium 43-16]|nr:MAG: hypothetical protein BGO31_12960 [Bacteroidetes bacterium 43-16]
MLTKRYCLSILSSLLLSGLSVVPNTAQSQERPKNVVKISGGYVTFGTWDMLGYGISTSYQRSLVKKPRLGLGDFQFGGELFMETGATGQQLVGSSRGDVDKTYATNTTTSLWVKGSYYPFHKIVPGFYIAVGPTVGYKRQIHSSQLNIVHNPSAQIYRKEILNLEEESAMYLGYRLSFGYDISIRNFIIGVKGDFNNNTFGNVNLYVGGLVGVKF